MGETPGMNHVPVWREGSGQRLRSVSPVAAQTAALLDAPPALLYFGLLVGATLGGNLTPVGASANIAGIGVLRRAGYPVKNRDFVRIGVPFTVAAVTAGYALLWLLWA